MEQEEEKTWAESRLQVRAQPRLPEQRPRSALTRDPPSAPWLAQRAARARKGPAATPEEASSRQVASARRAASARQPAASAPQAPFPQPSPQAKLRPQPQTRRTPRMPPPGTSSSTEVVSKFCSGRIYDVAQPRQGRGRSIPSTAAPGPPPAPTPPGALRQRTARSASWKQVVGRRRIRRSGERPPCLERGR